MFVAVLIKLGSLVLVLNSRAQEFAWVHIFHLQIDKNKWFICDMEYLTRIKYTVDTLPNQMHVYDLRFPRLTTNGMLLLPLHK